MDSGERNLQRSGKEPGINQFSQQIPSFSFLREESKLLPMITLEELEQQARQLPRSDRWELARRLMEEETSQNSDPTSVHQMIASLKAALLKEDSCDDPRLSYLLNKHATNP